MEEWGRERSRSILSPFQSLRSLTQQARPHVPVASPSALFYRPYRVVTSAHGLPRWFSRKSRDSRSPRSSMSGSPALATYFHRKDAKGNAAHSVRDRLTAFLFCSLLTVFFFSAHAGSPTAQPPFLVLPVSHPWLTPHWQSRGAATTCLAGAVSICLGRSEHRTH